MLTDEQIIALWPGLIPHPQAHQFARAVEAAVNEAPCATCAHHEPGMYGDQTLFAAACFECRHYYASKWEAKEAGK